jgi:hypothetical protein
MADSWQIAGTLHFQDSDEFFIHVVVVIWDDQNDDPLSLQGGTVVPC